LIRRKPNQRFAGLNEYILPFCQQTWQTNIRFMRLAFAGFFRKLVGIEGPEDSTDLSTAKPKLTGVAQPHPTMEPGFNKSKADGVNIYSKREGDAGFVYLARDTNSPYVDIRKRKMKLAVTPYCRIFRGLATVSG
jgi:hypothetical protein